MATWPGWPMRFIKLKNKTEVTGRQNYRVFIRSEAVILIIRAKNNDQISFSSGKQAARVKH